MSGFGMMTDVFILLAIFGAISANVWHRIDKKKDDGTSDMVGVYQNMLIAFVGVGILFVKWGFL